MSLFLILIQKLIPLYSLVLLGLFVGRRIRLDTHTLGVLLLYLIGPLVFLHAIGTMPFKPSALILPGVVYFFACSIACVVYRAGALLWTDRSALRNLAAFSAGTGNTGYFGIPVVLMLFGENAVGYNVLFIIGTVLFENTLGFYFAARSQFSPRESLQKIIRLPSVYAFGLGLLLSYFQVKFPTDLNQVFINVRGTYSFLGMLLIGLSLASGKFESDLRFMALSFLAKFAAWPLGLLTFAYLDVHYWHLLPAELLKVALIISAVPLAANTVVVATILGTEPRKVSFAVLVSTALSLLSIPLMVQFGLRFLENYGG